mgnify:FL=1
MSKYVLLAAMVFLAGCQTTDMYYWGSYENNLYESFKNDGSMTPEEEIDNLQNDIDRAINKDLAIAPGVYLQLGHLYYKVGDYNSARASFEAEKKLFPESSYFSNKLIEQLNNQ